MGAETPFFQTRMGHTFYNATMPRIAKALEAIAERLPPPPPPEPRTFTREEESYVGQMLHDLAFLLDHLVHQDVRPDYSATSADMASVPMTLEQVTAVLDHILRGAPFVAGFGPKAMRDSKLEARRDGK